MRDVVGEYEATGEPNLSAVAGCANARYTARVKGSRIDMTAPVLPLEINQMIVWIMHSPHAHYLLPRYRELRDIDEREAEGIEKSHGIDV